MPQAEGWGATAPTFPPPAGLSAKCPRCGTPLKTTDQEPEWKGIVHHDGPSNWPGWNLPCICGYQEVFFRMPDHYRPPAGYSAQQTSRAAGMPASPEAIVREVAAIYMIVLPPGFVDELLRRLSR